MGFHSANDPLCELEFADDVVLMARSRTVAQVVISIFQARTEVLGMQLNRNKIALSCMNQKYANKDMEVISQQQQKQEQQLM